MKTETRNKAIAANRRGALASCRARDLAQTSPRFLIVVLLLALLPALGLLAATGPAWWTERGVLNTNPANDYAAINQGQLKNIAVQAYAELHAKLPENTWTNTSGMALTNLIHSFQTNLNSSYNYSAVNLGQLKFVSAKFYDVLNSAGYTNSAVASPYPWSNSSAPNDYAMANIGQAKNVFSFDLSQFSTGLPDSEKQKIVDADPNDDITSITQVRDDDDFDQDGLTNLREFQLGTQSTVADTDGDGVRDGDEIGNGTSPVDFYNGNAASYSIVLIAGNNQVKNPGHLAPVPAVFFVRDANGNPVSNAPVTVRSHSDDFGFCENPSDSIGHAKIKVRTDESGRARAYIRFTEKTETP